MLKFKKITYTNIGPFSNKTKIIEFKQGKFLIKAPIGSGKSFLYFDGPTYALYKRSVRKMVNSNCSTGKIVFEFKIDDTNYKIERNLKKGKSKDSCKSRLWVEGEEIIFKNESDLQGNIDQLLPPREVFLATYLLMQDAPNIFELQAQNRLEVFKHIFNLLGIDEGKEILGEKKRELYSKVKVLEDTSKYDNKLNSILKDLINIINHIKPQINNIDNGKDILKFIEEINPFIGKLCCKDFNIELKGNEFEELKQTFEKQKENYTILKTDFENNKQQIQHKIKEKTQKKDFLQQIKSEVILLRKKINSFDQKMFEEKKLKKKTFLEEQNKIDEESKKGGHNIEKEINGIVDLWNYIQLKIQEGKDLKMKKDNLELKIKLLEQKEIEGKNEEKRKLEKISDEKNNIKEKIKEIEKRIDNEKNQLTKFEEMITEQSKFNCKKINGQCPFIKEINKKTFLQLEEQKNKFIENVNNLIDDKKKLEKKLEELKNIKIEDGKKNNKNEKETIQKEIQKLIKNIDDIKKFLNKTNRQQWKSKYDIYQEIEKNIKNIDIEIIKLEDLAKEIENNKQKIASLEGKIEQEEKNINNLDIEIKKTQKKGFLLEEKLKKIYEEIKDIDKNEENILKYEKYIENIKTLLSEFKTTQMETKIIKEEYKIVTDLYFIFSKELLLIVLQESIPILNEIVNSYLAEVVDYQIKMQIIQEGEKILLEILIRDKLGEREVKSLSGGQKVVLKIAWMLAVASYMKTSMLFLDETINNLDSESISGVAEMLENFVKQQQIDLYVVTHSSHIQEMDIWDEIINIDKI